MRFYLAAQISNLRKRFYDNFATRSNTSGNLGTATDGSRWTAINGIIQVVSGKAKASSIPALNASGSSYPMSTIDMPTSDNVIDVTDTYQGAAIALWVQSSSDWWLVDIDSTFNTIPGNTTYGVTGSNYITVGSNYGKTGSNYGPVGSNYGDTGDNYGIVGYSTIVAGSNYGIAYSNYNNVTVTNNISYTGTNLDLTKYTSYSQDTKITGWTTYKTANYQNWAITYGYQANWTSSASYGFGYVTNTTYETVTNYKTAPGTDVYGPISDNYKTISNYGWAGDNYGAVGSNYGFTGDNYGAIGSNYSISGSNYGATGTNATTYAYAQYLRIKQSSAGIVSTITSALISASQTINSLRVQLVGNQITAKAYSDTSLVTQIGSDLVHIATGAVVTTRFGIALSPSEYNQSDIIGSSVNITRV